MELKNLLYRISVKSDKKAFGQLFKLYHAKLISFSLCFLKDYADAEDVVSEVFIRLLKNKDRLLEIENFEGYLFHSVKNQSLSFLKRNKKRNEVFRTIDYAEMMTEEFVQPIHKLIEYELREEITRVVESLPLKRKMVYKMIKDDAMKISEVSELLGIADKTVKKHLELALRDVRNAISNYLFDKDDKTPIINIKSNFISIAFLTLMAEFEIFENLCHRNHITEVN
ncbi:sigma-70 family RNA polymerase sigma factor [Echinicola sp. 20G]|uniref:sigma-70 family RNA polymerase sigma factor n=1 Tax=Echinicola sp. 20G TaxID=2781961 RepID=UPI001F37D52C|nr:sigma-70 family RNA polymerase sigma factor [Echinicola sp. 20G]